MYTLLTVFKNIFSTDFKEHLNLRGAILQRP